MDARRRAPLAVAALLLAVLHGCAPVDVRRAPPAPAPPEGAAATRPETPAPAPTFAGRGKLSLYGRAHEGKPTASGEPFDPGKLTMAHRTLPFGTRVRVTNLENRRSVEVVVNDRGPFVGGRIADLSAAAARRLGMVEDGVVDGIVEVLGVGTP